MAEHDDVLQVQGINSKGFGTIPKLVMQDRRLTPQAKAIYAYFCSYAGAGRTAFPRTTKIIADLCMSKGSYYTHISLLKEHGYIKAEQEKDSAGRFKRNLYTLMEVLPLPQKRETVKEPSEIFSAKSTEPSTEKRYSDEMSVSPCPCFRDTVQPYTEIGTTNINNNKINTFENNHVSQVMSASPDRQDEDLTDDTARKIEAFTTMVKENISYADLAYSRPRDIAQVDEFIAIIVDTAFTKGKTVRISGEDKPRALVISVLTKLTYNEIEHAISQFKGVTERITKKKQYILTMLYNCKLEMDSHYTNAVISDRWQ